jgi:hypothetical protein
MRRRARASDIRFIKSSSGEPISKHNVSVADHFSTVLMLNFYHFHENSRLSSVPTIVDSLNIPASTIYSHLVERVDLKISYFAGFPAR